MKNFLCSSLGQKYLMALTGVALGGFLVAHLLGNLLLYCGPEALNAYAASLKSMPLILWGARLGLIGVFVVHIVVAMKLSCKSRQASPAYAKSHTVQASMASRSMVYTGLLVLCFIVYHLCHFTLGCVDADLLHLVDHQGRHDVYRMVVSSFRSLPVALSYIISMIVLGFHLCHGMSSFFQTLGIDRPHKLKCVGPAFAWVICLGNISLPISVYLGFIQ